MSQTKIRTNQIVGGLDGWIPIIQSLSVGSDQNGLDMIQISGIDLTSYVSVGMKIKVTQGGTVYYGVIHTIEYSGVLTSTIIGVFLSCPSGTRNRLDATTLSNLYYSRDKIPAGFPMGDVNWTLKVVNSTAITLSNGSSTTGWQDVGVDLSVPAGSWLMQHASQPRMQNTSADTMEAYTRLNGDGGTTDLLSSEFICHKFADYGANADRTDYIDAKSPVVPIEFTSEKTVNLIAMCNNETNYSFRIRGDVGPTIIYARNAYV